MDIFGTPPQYLEGLLGGQEVERLRKQSIGTGLLSALVGGLQAAPMYRTQGLAPVLGQALQSGMQGAQNVYGNAVQDYQTQQKIAEMQRQKEQQRLQDEAISKVVETNPELGNVLRAFPNAAPEVLSKLYAQGKGAGRLLSTAEAEQLGLSVDSRWQVKPDGTIEMVQGTQPKEQNLTDDIKEYRYAVDSGSFKGTFAEWQQMPRGTASRTVVNVPDKSFGEKFGEGVADRVNKTYDNAVAATNTLETIRTIRPALTAGVYSGPLARQERLISQIGSKLDVTGTNTAEVLKNTSTAIQGLAQLELEAAQALRGQGQITENEREIIRRASAGRLEDFTSPEIQTLLNVLEKTSKFKIQAHEKNLSSLRKRKDVGDLLDMYELPAGNKVKVNY